MSDTTRVAMFSGVAALATFISARYELALRKARGLPPPWTEDPILQQYRFCNVRREDDAVTRWIAANWRSQPYDDFWFASVVARYVNEPATLAELPHPCHRSFTPDLFAAVLARRAAKGLRVFNPAYSITTQGSAQPKAVYIAERILQPLYVDKQRYRPKRGMLLEDYYKLLLQCRGLSSFMAAQVIADTKYVKPLTTAEDWWYWAASGPGSKRGLNRVCGERVDRSWNEQEWLFTMQALEGALCVHPKMANVPLLHMQDLQNCLCEFDKYERVRTGQSVIRPYKPKERENERR